MITYVRHRLLDTLQRRKTSLFKQRHLRAFRYYFFYLPLIHRTKSKLQVNMEYHGLLETSSIRRSSTITINSTDTIQVNSNHHLCHVCKNKLMNKQETTHTPIECLGQRCQSLETEIVRLKDHDIKSNLQIKELENKTIVLEDTINGLIAPKYQEAAPYSFGKGHKLWKKVKKLQSEHALTTPGLDINYDNIIATKQSNNRDHVGLFGTRGASSQNT